MAVSPLMIMHAEEVIHETDMFNGELIIAENAVLLVAFPSDLPVNKYLSS